MSDYNGMWNTAKTNFENVTGLNKPVMKGKLLFVAYRKQTGIENAFKDFDKLNPTQDLDRTPPKQLASLKAACTDLVKKADAYIGTLEDSIAKEKADAGKTDQYRELKILKQKLLVITGKAEGDVAKVEASLEASAKKYERQGLSVLTVIKGLGSGIKSTSAAALVVMQGLLKDPTPANFKAKQNEISKASRDLTQNLSNVLKWAFPDDLNPRSAASREQLLAAEPKVLAMVEALQTRIEHVRRDLLPLVAQQGNTPTTADLAVYANDFPTFGPTATDDDVKAAIKHYVGMVKQAIAIGEQLK